MDDTETGELKSEPRTLKQKAFGAGFAIAGFLLMYCLLAGPVAGIHRRVEFGPFRRAIEVLYAPIVVIVENDIEPVASIMKAYVQLFR